MYKKQLIVITFEEKYYEEEQSNILAFLPFYDFWILNISS